MWRACVLLGLALAGCGNHFTHVYLNPERVTVTVGERATVQTYSVIGGWDDLPYFRGTFVSADEAIATVQTFNCFEPTSCRAEVEGISAGITRLHFTLETDGDVEEREIPVRVDAAP